MRRSSGLGQPAPVPRPITRFLTGVSRCARQTATRAHSPGLSELLVHRRMYRENHRRVVLANPQPHVRNVIDRLSCYRIIPVFPSVETAERRSTNAMREFVVNTPPLAYVVGACHTDVASADCKVGW
jgi:hypothetical protein